MAFSATAARYGGDKSGAKLGVIGLEGDGKLEGYFFKFPQVKLLDGRWRVEAPLGMKREFCRRRNFETLGDVFDLETRYQKPEGQRYRDYIVEVLEAQSHEGKKFGAVVLEVITPTSTHCDCADFV